MLYSDSILEIMTEQQVIKKNLSVIRAYLKSKFPDYTITEETDPSFHHKFIVTSMKLHKSYNVKVLWSRLSDRGNTQEKTKSELDREDVASCMIEAGEDGFQW